MARPSELFMDRVSENGAAWDSEGVAQRWRPTHLGSNLFYSDGTHPTEKNAAAESPQAFGSEDDPSLTPGPSESEPEEQRKWTRSFE